MTSGEVAGAASSDNGGADRGGRIELVATVLLALAAVLTAWTTFESTKWGGVQADQYSQGGGLRTEATRFDTLAGQQTQIDIALFLGWLGAVQSDIREGATEAPDSASEYVPDSGTLSGFLFLRLGDRLTPAMSAWLATDPFTEPDAPASPFSMDEYENETEGMAAQLRMAAEAAIEEARAANQISDDYVLTVISFALVLFFSALVGNMKTRRVQIAVIALAAAALLLGVTTTLTLPIEV